MNNDQTSPQNPTTTISGSLTPLPPRVWGLGGYRAANR